MSQKINEHLRFLNQETNTIAAGTEEEFQAADYISRIFHARDLDSTIQEFGISSNARLFKSIAYICVFAGALLSGMPIGWIKVLGTILLVVAAGLILFDELKTPIFSKIGPMSASQNIIAKHEGCGEKAGRGVRPIVIVAHYDTPQESYLSANGYGHFKPLFIKATFWTTVVALVLSLFKLFFPVGAFYNATWVISFICATVPLAFGVISIIDGKSSYTKGANNNKASLAAMFSIMDRVKGIKSDDMYENLGVVIKESQTDQFEALSDEDIEQGTSVVYEEVNYTHYGEEAIRMLGILPSDCEINYVYPPAPVDMDSTQQVIIDPQDKIEDVTPESDEWGQTEFEPLPSSFSRKSALIDLPNPLEDSFDGLSADTGDGIDPIMSDQPSMADLLSDDYEGEVSIDTSSDEGTGSKLVDGAKKFGKSFKGWAASKSKKKDWKGGATPNGKFKVIGGNDSDEDEETPSLEDMQEAIMQLAEDDEVIEQNENIVDDVELDEVSEDAEISESEEEEVEEDSNLDEDLICHDIWFVALGASEEGHRGMEEFLSEYRKELRGAFLVNLDAIGTGDLTLVSEEGFHNTRKADRRMSRIIKNVAKDMNLELNSAPYTFEDTDATPAMRTSLRCVTLMGMNAEGKAQHASLQDNDLSEIDSRQIAEVSYLVEEMIRRS